MTPLSADETPDQPERKPSRRGGRRPGAGAPKGNLNALKHGANSQQLRDLAIALSLVPDTRKALVRLVRRHRHQQGRARTVATKLLTNLLRTCLQTIQAGDDHPYSDTVTIVSNTDPPAQRGKKRDINQAPQSDPPDQSK
jgi:hypothetical protein